MNDFDDMSLLEDIYNFEFESVNITRSSLQTMLQYEMYGDTEVMMEGVRDIFSNMAAAIRKLIDAITGFFTKFLRIFQAHSMDHAKFCDKWGDKIIEAADKAAEDRGAHVIATVKGFDFKVLDRPDPSMKCFDDVVQDYNWLSLKTLPMASADAMGDKAAADTIASYKSDTNEFLSDRHLDSLRGEVLGTNKPISSDDFRDAIQEFYFGSKEKIDIAITPNLLRKLIDRADTIKAADRQIRANKAKIITLLTKSEAFFGKKAEIVYDRGYKVVDQNAFNYDDDGNIHTDSQKNRPAEKYLADVNTLLSLTYSRTKAVATIINTTITAQADAISKMMSQDHRMVGMFGSSPWMSDRNTTKAPRLFNSDKLTMLDEDGEYIDDATNYINMDRMSDCTSHHAVTEGLNHEMLLEGAWLETAYENGVIEDVVIESKIGTILGDAAQAIIRKFREININNMQKRSPWYSNNDVATAITTAANDQDMTIAPMWTGIYSNAETSKIAKLAMTVSDPKSNLSGYSWAGNFVTLTDSNGGLRQDDLDKKLLNYFLFGKNDTLTVSPVKLSGAKLSSTVSNMFKYLNDYKSIIQSTTQTLDKAVTKTYQTTESFGIASYSNLLGMNVRDTDLSVLLEFGGSESGTGMGNSGVASANRGTSSEKESGAAMTKPVKNDVPTDGTNKSSNRAEAARFAKRVIRAYITSIEMRFVLYFNTINDCAPSDYKYSKWMKDHTSNNANDSTKPTRNS